MILSDNAFQASTYSQHVAIILHPDIKAFTSGYLIISGNDRTVLNPDGLAAADAACDCDAAGAGSPTARCEAVRMTCSHFYRIVQVFLASGVVAVATMIRHADHHELLTYRRSRFPCLKPPRMIALLHKTSGLNEI